MAAFGLLLLIPLTPLILFLARRKELLTGNATFIVASLVLSYLLVPVSLFLYFSVVAYSFKGAAFENTMLALVALLGAVAIWYGSVLRFRAAIPFLTAGLTEWTMRLFTWLLPAA